MSSPVCESAPFELIVVFTDLQSFRQALSILQAEVDELDRLKVSHYNQILDHEEEVWDVVAGKVCLVVRSSLDVFDRVTSKAYVVCYCFSRRKSEVYINRSDSVLETMVQSIPDPFDSYGPPKQEGQLFSILTPLAMNPDAETSEDSVNSWTDEFGVVFPRTERTRTEMEDAPGRARRHSAPMASSSSLANSSLKTHAPSPIRRPQLPTILSVIDENRGKLEAQQFGDEVPHQSMNNAPEDLPGCQSPSNELTPTNSIFRPSSPHVTARSDSPTLHEPSCDHDMPSQVAD